MRFTFDENMMAALRAAKVAGYAYDSMEDEEPEVRMTALTLLISETLSELPEDEAVVALDVLFRTAQAGIPIYRGMRARREAAARAAEKAPG